MSDISSHKTGSWRYRDTAGATQRYNEAGINQCPETFLSVLLTFSCENIFPLFPFPSLCRWSIWQVPGVGWSRPVHVRYLFLCSTAPQDPPSETGAQRYRVPICLSFFLRMCYFLCSAACVSHVQPWQKL